MRGGVCKAVLHRTADRSQRGGRWPSLGQLHWAPLPLAPCPLPLASSLPGKNEAEGEGAESAHRVTGSLECDGNVEASVDAECSEATVERMAVVCVVVAGLVRRLINA